MDGGLAQRTEGSRQAMLSVSIVIPAKNESENIPALLDEIHAAVAPLVDYEVIVIDDGSTDGMDRLLMARMDHQPNLRVLRNERSAGQSAAVHSGVQAARAEVICTLDADGQNPPEFLPALFQPLLAGPPQLGLVAGQRVNRQDTWSKRMGSKFANGIRSWALNDGTRDTGCGLKGFRREAFLALPYFDHMHRYLPALFRRDNWDVLLVDVGHRPRGAGRSNYSNLQRALVGIVDLAGVMWLVRRNKKATPLPVVREGKR